MKLYHGSTEIVASPEIRDANRPLDYGSGFYTTTSFEQATAWVKRRMKEYKKAYPELAQEFDDAINDRYSLLVS